MHPTFPRLQTPLIDAHVHDKFYETHTFFSFHKIYLKMILPPFISLPTPTFAQALDAPALDRQHPHLLALRQDSLSSLIFFFTFPPNLLGLRQVFLGLLFLLLQKKLPHLLGLRQVSLKREGLLQGRLICTHTCACKSQRI